ncbi:MAG: FAD-binding and (Fe-S)-binding domain-containing protein [Colwellia sp.]
MTEPNKSERFESFTQQMHSFLSDEQIIVDMARRYAFGTDASFYRLTPKMILRLNEVDELVQVIAQAYQYNIALTFRAAGTSLSGQAITDSVLILLSSTWQCINILDEGKRVSLQPGVIGANANAALKPYRRKIGPDPASINTCKIGGIAANNASGMCCGVKQNSYHTLGSIKIILASGTKLNTACEDSIAQFSKKEAQLIEHLNHLAANLQNSPELVSKIKHKYRLKNTTGYGVNALVDFESPIDMISHLMIGSEGTLGFIEEITYNTVKIEPFKSAGLYVFKKLSVTCDLVRLLANEEVDAVELLDVRSLESVDFSGVTGFEETYSQAFKGEEAALLIEFSATTQQALENKEALFLSIIQQFEDELVGCSAFTVNEEQIDKLWQIRKGLFPSVGANRETGTTVVIEDVALPIEKLSQGVADLQSLLAEYGFDEAIIFGHALDGNLHFVFTPSFEQDKEVKRYERFMAKVSEMVAVEYQGSLKAEHGTGRNMAPFVSLEWGQEIYQVMQEIKSIFDPKGILNPGVIINEDSHAHIKHLKPMPAANEIIDKCIECGFCEPVCPSKNLTLSPRQRIALWRRIKALELNKEQAEFKELNAAYQYLGIDSCAATGLCSQSCPVNIDTGQFIKELRALQHGQSAKQLGQFVGRHFSASITTFASGLNAISKLNDVIGDKATAKIFSALNTATAGYIPKWYPQWPSGAKRIPLKLLDNENDNDNEKAKESKPAFTSKVIYIPACPNRVFASQIKPTAEDNDELKSDKEKSLTQVIASLCAKAKIELVIPDKIDSLCCGMPWESKGLISTALEKKQAFKQFIREVSENGKWPVITDASPCALSLTSVASASNQSDESTMNADRGLNILDATEFVAKEVIDKLEITRTDKPFMLHKTCSSIKMNQGVFLTQIANKCSTDIIIPKDVHCCGFAGDKGFYLPELTDTALATLKEQVPKNCTIGLSNSRTCEIGLSKNSGIHYQSVLTLLDDVSQAISV